MRLNFLSLLILVIVVGASVGGAYGAGVLAGKGTATTPAQAQNPAAAARTPDSASTSDPAAAAAIGRAGAAATAGRGGIGTVEKIEGNTLTIATATGGTTQVTLGEDTPIQKAAEASREELKPGVRVMVTGQQGSGGGMIASSIQIVTADAGSGPRPTSEPASRPTPG